MKALQKGDLNLVDEKLIFPLNTWCSNYYGNINICKLINRNVFYVSNKLSLLLLSRGIKPQGFIPYPKAKKFDDKKFELVKTYLIKEFKFGTNDISSLNNILLNLIKSKQLLEEFSDRYGLDNKERKIIGLKPIKFDKSKMKPKKGIDLFSM